MKITAFENSQLGTGDYVTISIYFACVLIVGFLSLFRPNRGTVAGYFLAGRYMIWLPVGASLFASNIGSEHFIGLAGSGAAAGISVGAFEFNACLLMLLLGWVFLPTYIASGVCTLPEYMKQRFGGERIRVYLSLLSLTLYVFTKISVNLYSGALFIQQAVGWNLYISILLLLFITAVCTITGGLAAVIYTDTLQALIMVVGSSILAIMSFNKIGGMSELYKLYPLAISNSTRNNINSTCGLPNERAFQMLRPINDPDLPWLGFLFGQTPASIWYWCADQMMVQRALAAKSLSHAQGGTILTAALKLLPLFVIVMPGMISRILYADQIACSDPDVCFSICQSRSGCSNIAYPKLVLGVLPDGMRGVMMAVMLAALMSDLTSIFNSSSTLFTMDLYTRIRKQAKTRELMIVGRLFVVVMVVVSILWIPMITEFQGGQLFIYIQMISAHLAPPIAAIYLVAILWTRGTERGAFWGLMVGAVVGFIRMVLDFVYRDPVCGDEDRRPSVIANFHYMYFAMLLFLISLLTMVVLSLLDKPPSPDKLFRTTFWTRYDERPGKNEDCFSTSENLMSVHQMNDIHTDNTTNSIGDAALIIKSTDLVVMKPDDKSCPTRAFYWFCGFDESEKGEKARQEQAVHLSGISQLKQDPRAKILLNICMLTVMGVAVFLYGYFSAPPIGI